MDNIQGVEGFLAEFLEWYGPFLQDVKGVDLRDPDGETHKDIIIEPIERGKAGSRTGFPYWHQVDFDDVIKRGSLPELIERELELQAKVEELNATHETAGMPSLRYLNPGGYMVGERNVKLPQYDLFVPEIKFRSGREHGQKVRVGLNYGDGFSSYHPSYELLGDVGVGFIPTPEVPGERIEGRNERKEKWHIHPEGEDVAALNFTLDTPYGKGNFFFGGERVLKFHVRYGPGERDGTGQYKV